MLLSERLADAGAMLRRVDANQSVVKGEIDCQGGRRDEGGDLGSGLVSVRDLARLWSLSLRVCASR